jgi:Zn-dependent protease with chaperone function
MIDDDVAAIKRRILLEKLSFALYFSIYCCLYILPLIWLFVFKLGLAGRIALLVSASFLALIIIFLIRRGEWLIRRLTGAVAATKEQFEELKSLSEDISLATGRPLPDLMLIEDKRCCNLFSIKKQGKAVIFLGRGLLNRMEPDELRAAIGHEMAHIYNGDAEINTLTVSFKAVYEYMWSAFTTGFKSIFRALMTLALLACLGIISLALLSRFNIAALLILAVALPFVFIFFFNEIFSFFLPSIIIRRDLYADELALKWTLQPESLISAMRKAQLHDKSEAIAFLGDIPFVPTVLENPHKYLQSPSVEKRIENLDKVARLALE